MFPHKLNCFAKVLSNDFTFWVKHKPFYFVVLQPVVLVELSANLIASFSSFPFSKDFHIVLQHIQFSVQDSQKKR